MGYPPGGHVDGLVEGFAYPIVDGRVDGSRVRASIEPRALWAEWCALQPAYPHGEQYACNPHYQYAGVSPEHCWYTDPVTGSPHDIDCDRMALCDLGSACDCDATGCQHATGGLVALDFRVVGDAGDGSVTLRELYNVHLTRR